MRPKESYTPHLLAALGLTLAILGAFQVYIMREPERIAADEKRDALIAKTAGRTLYAENCALCHGEQGEGVDGPPLNDKRLLSDTPDQTIFSLISSGIPSSEMPAWSQTHGGPFTDQQVSQLVAYLRSWEADAPDRLVLAMAGDPVAGLTIYSSKCVICHGENGSGSERAPALNDPIKLSQLDDDWYADTIAQGRPAQGMPTWGTVLAPTQIQDLVALLRAWEHAEDIQLPGPQEPLDEALHLLEHGDLNAVAHALEEAEAGASGDARVAIQEAISAAEQGDQEAVETAIMRAQSLIGLEPDHADEEQHDQ